MEKERLSDHCSLMKHPERTTRPSDCPEGGTYVKTTDKGGAFELHPITPFPLIIEGGEGNDKVSVIGTPRNPVLIDGGKGNDEVVVDGGKGHDNVVLQSDWARVAGHIGPEGLLILGALLIAFATIGLICWRALASVGVGRTR
jgi:hypothetical protein